VAQTNGGTATFVLGLTTSLHGVIRILYSAPEVRRGRRREGKRTLSTTPMILVRVTAAPLESEELLRISVRDAFAVSVADRQPIQKRACLLHRCVRIIGREHDAIHADFHH
jgi:hypothetical protein